MSRASPKAHGFIWLSNNQCVSFGGPNNITQHCCVTALRAKACHWAKGIGTNNLTCGFHIHYYYCNKSISKINSNQFQRRKEGNYGPKHGVVQCGAGILGSRKEIQFHKASAQENLLIARRQPIQLFKLRSSYNFGPRMQYYSAPQI